MTEIEEAESLLAIIADELNIKKLVLFDKKINHVSVGTNVKVEYMDGKIKVYNNGVEANAPKTALYFAKKFLESGKSA